MKKILVIVSFMLSVCNANAYFDGGIDQVFGDKSYKGTNIYMIMGSEKGLWLRPAVGMYKSDYSRTTFKTYSGRAGYDTEVMGVAAEAGATSKADGYSNAFAGADVTFSLSPTGGRKARLAGPQSGGGSARGEGLARVDVGGGIMHTAHKDELDASGTLRASAFELKQTDLFAFAGAKFLSMNLGAQFNVSGYDKTINTTDRAGRRLALPGLISIVQGFARQSLNLKAEWGMLPFVTPFVSYTYAKFKAGMPSGKGYVFGASVGLDMLEARGSVEVYDPGNGADKLNHVSIGAGLRF